MRRLTPLILLVAALAVTGCKRSDDGDTGRTPCEDACFEADLRPCRDNCPAACAGAGDQNRCLDACQGDCIGEYDRCVEDSCSGSTD